MCNYIAGYKLDDINLMFVDKYLVNNLIFIRKNYGITYYGNKVGKKIMLIVNIRYKSIKKHIL